jgi:hypothetical protein
LKRLTVGAKSGASHVVSPTHPVAGALCVSCPKNEAGRGLLSGPGPAVSSSEVAGTCRQALPQPSEVHRLG